MSRVTRRQAVQALVHVGLLQTIQGNGTFVRATTEVDAVLSRYLAGEDLLSALEVREAFYAAVQAGATRAIATADGPQTPAEFLDEHRAIAAAIRDRNPAAAREHSQLHIQPVIEAVKNLPPES